MKDSLVQTPKDKSGDSDDLVLSHMLNKQKIIKIL